MSDELAPPELRIWSEELADQQFRLTWRWRDEDHPTDLAHEQALVIEMLAELEGVAEVSADADGVSVTVSDPELSRQEIAALIRSLLGEAPTPSLPAVNPNQIRVWAEDLDDGSVRLTWGLPPDLVSGRDQASDRRRVAARLAVLPAVEKARTDPEGVVVRYDGAAVTRHEIANLVRQALLDPADLRGRTSALLGRAGAYGKLARTLAVDERVSPLPNAARQAALRRPANPAANPALRIIPGFAAIQRIQMLLPVIQGLSQWSREAPPEVVEQHLADAGLDRQTLDIDYATCQEAVLFAKEIGGQRAGEIGQRVSGVASQAIEASREWVERRRQPRENP